MYQLALPEEVLKNLQPWLISVCETGSVTIPWIQNARDRDVVFYVKHNNSSEEVRLFKSLIKQYKPQGECWILEVIPDRKYLFAYQYHFLKPLFGETIPTWDIFEPVMKARTKRFLIHWAKIHSDPGSKLWYHVLTLIYLFRNNEYSLTEDQIKNVQACHDRQLTTELYNFIITELNHYAAEFGITPIDHNGGYTSGRYKETT